MRENYPMLIAHLTDTHIDPEGTNGDERARALAAVVKHINQLSPQPDVAIHTGDLAHNGDKAKYTIAAELLGELRPPLYVAAGNRDDRGLLRQQFCSGVLLSPDQPFIQFSVDNYPVRLIGIDTVDSDTNVGTYCDKRAGALFNALNTDNKKSTILFMHHPPFEVTESKYPWQFSRTPGIVNLTRALHKQNHVIKILCGHTHRYSTSTLGHIPAATAPCVAPDLRVPTLDNEKQQHTLFMLHKVSGNSVNSAVVSVPLAGEN